MSFCYEYMNVLLIIPLSSNTKDLNQHKLVLIHYTYTFNYFNLLFYYLHRDLKIPTVKEEASKFSNRYNIRVNNHQNLIT